MNHLTVNIPELVQDKIREQVFFIAKRHFGNAVAWERRLIGEINKIGEMPFDSVDPDATNRLGRPVRKRVFERTYLIFYVVDDAAKTAEIIGFRHGARLPRRGEP